MRMTERPLSLNVPRQCPECGGIGNVKLETTIKGPIAALVWKCGLCNHRWAVNNMHIGESADL